MHQIILHDFTSGGHKVAPHNAVPRGIAWRIILEFDCEINGLEALKTDLNTSLFYF